MMHNAFCTYLISTIHKDKELSSAEIVTFIKKEQGERHRWNYWKKNTIEDKYS